MTKLNPWFHGAVVSITVVINYVLCTLFWFAFTAPSIKFLNTLFHCMDFAKIYAPSDFSLADFAYVLILFSVWAYVLGAIYAVARNTLIKAGTA